MGCLLLITIEKVLLFLEALQKHRTEYFPQLHPLLHAVELYTGKVIYFLAQTYHSWTELEVLSMKKISEHQPPLLRPWCSVSLNVAGPPPFKQVPLQSGSLIHISTLPEEVSLNQSNKSLNQSSKSQNQINMTLNKSNKSLNQNSYQKKFLGICTTQMKPTSAKLSPFLESVINCMIKQRK